MAEFIMLDELDEEILDFDANTNSSDMNKVDSILIKRILNEMKNKFNKSPSQMPDNDNIKEQCTPKEEASDNEDLPVSLQKEEETPEEEAKEENIEENANSKPEGVVDENILINTETVEELQISETLNDVNNDASEVQPSENCDAEVNAVPPPTEDPSPVEVNTDPSKSDENVTLPIVETSAPSTPTEEVIEVKKTRRGSKPTVQSDCEVSVKRSSRRMSKENSRESVLQTAIALKEKSFSSLNQPDEKPHRRSTRLVESELKNVSKLRQRCPRLSWQESTDSTNSCSSTNENGQKNSSNKLPSKNTDKKILPDGDCDNNSKSFALNETVKYTEENDLKQLTDSETNDQSAIVKSKRKRKRSPIEGSNKKSRCDEGEVADNFAESKAPSIPLENGGYLCECTVTTNLFVNTKDCEDEIFCMAIDSVEKKAVGCDNIAVPEFPLMRPKSRVPYMFLCSVHIERLMRHNCCPLCGIFCTRGLFMYCKGNHFYHKDCDSFYQEYSICPHCDQSDTREVILTLAKNSNPFFLPDQKVFNKKISARITAGSLRNQRRLSCSRDDYEDVSLVLKLPSGKELSLNGIPSFEKDVLKKCLSMFTSKNADSHARFTNKHLFQASKNGELERMIQILWTGLSPNNSLKEGTPLHAAARGGHLAAVHLLIQAGSNMEVLDKEQYTPLMLAALNGHHDVVLYLIKAGADRLFKGYGGMTALHIAAKEGHLKSCHFLLSNIGSPYPLVNAVDEGNWTALVWAAENKQAQVVRFLIEKKADVHIRDTERNIALHWASLASSFDILEDLLNCGSDINATNVYGDTPLHIASREGSSDCVTLLLSRGAIPDLLNKGGMVPRDCTREPNPYIYDLITVSMKFTLVVSRIPVFPRVLSNDVSRGKETFPIQCINEIDDDTLPKDFTYITENCITTNIHVDNKITSLIPCKCDNNCNSDTCVCTVNSKGCWYDQNGKLVPDFNYEDPPLVFECNTACECNTLTCVNRVVQKGIKVSLQMYKTPSKNWGVITLRDIPKGTYVCEYIGEIISDSEADTRHDDSYLFDLDNKESESYCIDARWYGNITRFINHSCRPNLFPVRVFINHQDLRFPRIAFFASRDIPAFEELGFDYGEKFWMVKYKTFTCTCGEDNCRYSTETIHQTVEKYHENLKLEEQSMA